MSEDKNTLPRWQQTLYIIAPFFLLLIFLGLINFVPRRTTEPVPTRQITGQAAQTAATAVPTNISSPQPTSSSTPTPEPTITPTPTLPPDAAITLLGPPADGHFRRSDTISFYGEWPLELVDGQVLAAYLRFDDGSPISLGQLVEPNLGKQYRWQVKMSDLDDTAVSFQWWIQLQTETSNTPLLTSPLRDGTLLP
jgi:hypothetical protein